jgi:hypothetical protein
LGQGYVEVEARLEMQDVLALCGVNVMSYSDPGPCAMGVDQGSKLHVIIGKKHRSDGDAHIVYACICDSWEDLDELLTRYNVDQCVVDGLPEQSSAKKFAERHWGKIYLNYYNKKMTGRTQWNAKDLTVSENRTESLDNSQQYVTKGWLHMPRKSETIMTVAKHFSNIAKKLDEDYDTGSQEYSYIKLGPDHYRHAFNYMIIALERVTAQGREKSPVILEGFRAQKQTEHKGTVFSYNTRRMAG